MESAYNSDIYMNLLKSLMIQLQRPISPAKVVELLATAVKLLQPIKDLTGHEKRDLAIKAVTHVISRTAAISEEDAQYLNLLLETVGETIINTLVDFGKDVKTFAKRKCL